MNDIQLNDQQQQAFDFVTEGHNVFITGSAGVGKSVVIKKIKEWGLQRGKQVAVTATTGVAAANINGSTIHSWASIRLGKGEPGKFAFYIKKNEAKYKRYLNTDILIVDEISMADFEYFTTFNLVAQLVRDRRGIPFGGIQIVVCGDFFQLGPVQKNRKTTRFIFEDIVWDQMVSKIVHFTQVYRQTNGDFIDMLHKIRVGNVTDDMVARIKATEEHKLVNDKGIKPTILFCRNVDVDAINISGIKRLNGEEHVFDCTTYFADDECKQLYGKSFTLPENITLKVGAQVMLIQNLDVSVGLVNGSRGVVVAISPEDDEIEVQFMNGVTKKIIPFKQAFTSNPTSNEDKDEDFEYTYEEEYECAYRIQYPLKLAYALTIHKSQGLSIDFLKIDLNGCFAAGQAYVALSRATSFDTLCVRNFTKKCVITSKVVMDYYDNIAAGVDVPKRKMEGPLDKMFPVKKQKIVTKN